MLKLNTNKIRDSFILFTGVLVMVIICYMGVNEIKEYTTTEKLELSTHAIDTIEERMQDKLKIEEFYIFKEKKSDVKPYNDQVTIPLK